MGRRTKTSLPTAETLLKQKIIRNVKKTVGNKRHESKKLS